MAIQFEHTIEVAQPPKAVFAVLDDVKKTPLWLARCTGIEMENPGPLQAGAKLKYSYKEGGRSGVMDGEVKIREENRQLSFLYWDEMMEVSVQFRMEPKDSGTSLCHTIVITPKTFMAKMFTPIIKMQLPKTTIAAMETLGSLLASEAAVKTA